MDPRGEKLRLDILFSGLEYERGCVSESRSGLDRAT